MNEYDEILNCLSDVLNDENARREFYSIDNFDDKYEYFSKLSGKIFSKEKFKEVIDFLEEQTKKIKNGELSEESLKNIAGGEEIPPIPIPETEHRRYATIIGPGSSYLTDVLDTGRNIGEIINLIQQKISYETENENLIKLQEKANKLKAKCNEKRRKKGLPEIM